MRLSNDLFARALDWIYTNVEGVKDQKALAVRTGITETTISRILNDKVKQPSSETIQKLNAAFGGIFNPAYFRGESIYLLTKDAEKAKFNAQENVTDTSEDETTSQLLEMYAQRVRLVDDMRESLKNELDDIRAIKSELQQARDDFRDATYRMTQFMRNMSEPHQNQSRLGIAAEDINEPKNP